MHPSVDSVPFYPIPKYFSALTSTQQSFQSSAAVPGRFKFCVLMNYTSTGQTLVNVDIGTLVNLKYVSIISYIHFINLHIV